MNYLLNTLKNKKILIYGTGVWCRRLIDGLKDSASIIGILDKEKTEGEIQGIPILKWENIQSGVADAVIIASRPQFYKEIYTRIFGKCLNLGLDIYSADGQNLKNEYDKAAVNIENALYYAKTKEQLLNKIAEYDAISFDVFDTLVMRKTLEPADIFDIVDEKLHKKGVTIENFSTRRRTAESRLWQVLPHCTIDDIYEFLQSELHLDSETANLAKKIEEQCELENLVPRKTMVEVFNEALRMKKKVNLVSDMYYPADVLGKMLQRLGIDGYDKLYVSCDYKTGKSENLFAEYKKDIDAAKALHIGDNKNADIIAPRKYEIDSFEVWSAYKMLENSSMSNILVYAASKLDRLFLGHFIADVLNDPFALHEYSGGVHVVTIEQFSYFLMPIVMLYMQNLYKVLDSGSYNTVLFSSRDCYLMKRIFDEEILRPKKEGVRSVYFLTSRRVVLKAAFSNLENVINYADYLNCPEMFFKHLNRIINSASIQIGDKISHNELDIIKDEANKTKTNYMNYIKKNNLKINESCLLCDLISSGTVHYYLNRVFNCTMDGLYLATTTQFSTRNLNVHYIYRDWNKDSADTKLLHFLEKIITAPESSVADIDSSGNPIYSKNERSIEELNKLKTIHDSICNYIKNIVNYSMFDNDFSVCFARNFAEICSKVVLPIDLYSIFGYYTNDDLGPQKLEIMPLHFESI